MSVFAVSKVLLKRNGDVSHVQWGVVDTKSNQWVTPEVIAPVEEVVDAIRRGDHVVALFPTDFGHVPGSEFVIVEGADGPRVRLAGVLPTERQVHLMDKLDPVRVLP